MWFRWFDGQTKIKNITGGSVLQKFNKTDFKNLRINKPSEELLQKFDKLVAPLFDKLVAPLFDKITDIAKENQYLAHLRDGLLPKLMSGEMELGC